MTSKEKLSQAVKSWITLEKEIQLLQKEIKDRKLKKNELTKTLVEVMKSKEIDCFDMSEGKIVYTKTNVKQAINKAHLMKCLEQYFKDDPSIPADEIVQYILDNRAVNVKETIKHKG
jgi:hypothetical protein